MSLAGKKVLVTGATRGIGKAVFETFGQAGALVIGTATSEEGAEKIQAFAKSANIQGQGLVLNIGSTDSVEQAFTQMGDAMGMPEIVINNAGMTMDNLFLRMSEEQWQNVINTNLTGVFRVIRACLKPMVKAKWGRIVNVSSVVGALGNAGQANYSAAKAGVIAMTKSLAQEVGSRGITVNAVAPGFIATDMTKDLPEAHAENLLKQIPMKRMGEAHEIAKAIMFLASEEAGYITGETLHVNGGMYMA